MSPSGLNTGLGFGSLLLSALSAHTRLVVLSVSEHGVKLLGWSPCVVGRTRGCDSCTPFPCVRVIIVLQSGVDEQSLRLSEKQPYVSVRFCIIVTLAS